MVEVFDPLANRWEKCHPMTTARSRVGVAVVNGLLYAIGGYDGQLRLSTVEVYNPETDTWARAGSMNSKRRYPQTHAASGAPCWASRATGQHTPRAQAGTPLQWERPRLPRPPSSEGLGERRHGQAGAVLLLSAR